MNIHVLHQQEQSIRAISRQLDIARNRVRCYLRDLASKPNYGPRPDRPSKLDSFKPYIRERIETAKRYWIPATILFHEIQTQEYEENEGGIKIYVRQVKPLARENIVRFEAVLRQQIQVDLIAIRRGHAKLKAFVTTMEFSRAT